MGVTSPEPAVPFDPPELRAWAEAEVEAADKVLGVTALVLDIHDGELMPTLDNRKIVTRLIRQWNADIVIAHRPYDYHPDHRYTGVLMQQGHLTLDADWNEQVAILLHHQRNLPVQALAT